MNAKKLFVIPEPVDVEFFNPENVTKVGNESKRGDMRSSQLCDYEPWFLSILVQSPRGPECV